MCIRDRANAYRLIEDCLNLKGTKIFDYEYDDDGEKVAILNKKETMIAQQKQDSIKDAFKNWIWKDFDRREHLTQKYNELFNSTRPREYNGDHLEFPNMNTEITLRKHQKDAIAHILYGNNVLLAHVVGAGKTYEMTAACMELKRLGLSQKSMFVVPNHLIEQWGSEFLQLYPSANILVAVSYTHLDVYKRQDVGLFITLAFKDKDFTDNMIYSKLLSNKLDTNLGYVYENIVAQMLLANGNNYFIIQWIAIVLIVYTKLISYFQ